MLGSGRKQGVDRGVTDRTERRGRPRLAALIGAITAIAVLPAPVAHAADWAIGDVAANTPDGATALKIFDNNGNFKEAIGKAGVSAEGTGCAFDANFDLYATFFQANQTVKFSSAHPHPDIQTIPNPGTNESIVFDAAGNFYIGMADTAGDEVRKYDPAGNLLDSYDLVTDRGADAIDLAADQQTLFYNGEGGTVRRYDLATHTQLPDFSTSAGVFALRLLPPGDGSGGLLTADSSVINRLDGSGNIVQTYTAPGEGSWFALNLDPNGTSFWSAGISSGNVYRFNIQTGAIEVGPIQAHPSEVAGLCVLGELTAAVPPPELPPEPPAPGAGTGSPCANVILGDSKGNNLQGTDGSDAVKGLGGNDKINAGSGDDCARGGPGHDNVDGGEGNDQVNGGPKPDILEGGPGDDLMKAIAGQVDIVNCGPGDDTVRAQKKDIVNKDCEKVTG